MRYHGSAGRYYGVGTAEEVSHDAGVPKLTHLAYSHVESTKVPARRVAEAESRNEAVVVEGGHGGAEDLHGLLVRVAIGRAQRVEILTTERVRARGLIRGSEIDGADEVR